MTPIEQILLARQESFLQIYCDEKVEGLVAVGVSLLTIDSLEPIMKVEAGSIEEALKRLNAELAPKLMQSAAHAFWEERGTEERKALTPAERSRAYRKAGK